MRNANVFHQSLVLNVEEGVHAARSGPLELHVDPYNVQFISITPKEKKDFSLTFKPVVNFSVPNKSKCSKHQKINALSIRRYNMWNN